MKNSSKAVFCFMINPFTDEYFMKKVLNEAEMALKR
jgi:tRNA(adenine34) deaminase